MAQLTPAQSAQVEKDLKDLNPEQQRQYMDGLEKQFAGPQGMHAAAAGAETIGETPWYSKNYMGLPSLTQATRALPAIGGMIGGAAASPGIVSAAGGAAIGGAGGESIRQLIMRGLGGKGPDTSFDAAKDIGEEALIQGGAQTIGGLMGKGLAAGGQRVMQSALKPNISLLKQYKTTAPQVVQTLLDEGINVTPGGIEKLDRLFQSTNAEIKEAVKNAPGLVDRKLVAARALPTAERLSEQVNPKAALRDMGKSIYEFMQEKVPNQFGDMVEVPLGPLSIPEAQAMKVGTYQQIGKNYGKISSATVETQKALARGLKEEIEAAIPKIKNLNAREGRLMAAQDAVGHRVAIAGNRDPVGFAWVTHAPQTFLAALMDRSPAVKSLVARGMYASAGKAANVSPQLIRAAVLALATGESEPEPARQ